MINNYLETFVCVAKSGSFNKAADNLFITPTAIMKQINSLETKLDLKLFERTKHGVYLTPAGKIIYNDSDFLFSYSKQSIKNARQAMLLNEKTFRVGTSLLNPAKPFMDLWHKLDNEFFEYKLNLVPFEDNHENILDEISQLGKKFDFLIGVCDSKLWLDRCSMLTLGNYKKMCAVSKHHPLSKKAYLDITDLYGQTLMLVRKGDSKTNDLIRKDLIKNHPEIILEETSHFYDISVFNRCVEKENVMLILECWQDVHPALTSIPVNWDYASPYGLLYSLKPSAGVLKFINSVKNLNKL